MWMAEWYAAQLLKEGVEGDRILVVDRGESTLRIYQAEFFGRELDELDDIFPNWEWITQYRTLYQP